MSSSTNTSTRPAVGLNSIILDSYLTATIPPTDTPGRPVVISPLSSILSSAEHIAPSAGAKGQQVPISPADGQQESIAWKMLAMALTFGLYDPSDELVPEGIDYDADGVDLTSADYSLSPELLPEGYEQPPSSSSYNSTADFQDAWMSYTSSESYMHVDLMRRLFVVNQRVHLLMYNTLALFLSLYGEYGVEPDAAVRAVQAGLALTVEAYMPERVTVNPDGTANATFISEAVQRAYDILTNNYEEPDYGPPYDYGAPPEAPSPPTQQHPQVRRRWRRRLLAGGGGGDGELAANATAALVRVVAAADSLLVGVQRQIAAVNASDPAAVLALDDAMKQVRRLLAVATTSLPTALAAVAEGSLSIDALLGNFTGAALLAAVQDVVLPEDTTDHNDLDGLVIGLVLGLSFGAAAAAVMTYTWWQRRRGGGGGGGRVAAEVPPPAAAGADEEAGGAAGPQATASAAVPLAAN
ncbi:hypothetical protein GPECTOR_122g463 [Gonium pectorale]|uniref:Uncharacterized protein n=1 Tax=Gonium pectorale TaxID=33097 RepID=A0A150FYN9_GONPE|nr:hypothetical protein GPECTOR_122g463 [Gonium pectorale]|eukprot:KXZ42722.1 hypothetical protein GPECTOR_122g463 [Gonium pectorale]